LLWSHHDFVLCLQLTHRINMVWVRDGHLAQEKGDIKQRPQKGAGKDKGKGSGKDGKDQFMQMMMVLACKGKGKGKAGMGEMAWMLGSMLGKGGADAPAAAPAPAPARPLICARSMLQSAYAKTHQEPLTKDTLVYTLSKEGAVHTATLACEKFSSDHEGTGVSQNDAKDAAAKAALIAEFPEFAKKFDEQPKVEPGTNLSWKSQLQQAFSKKNGSATKGDLVYTTEEQPDIRPQQYVSVVSSEKFDASYTGEAGQSKSVAEGNAAMVAMEAEFPQDFSAENAPPPPKHLAPGMKKRKREENIDSNPKSRLMCGLTVLGKKCPTRGMINYSVAEEGETSVGTVTVTGFGETQTFTGEPQAGTNLKAKKEAESSAAEVAYNHFKDQIEKADAEHQVVKKAKAEASKVKALAKFAEDKAKKREARALEQAAADA